MSTRGWTTRPILRMSLSGEIAQADTVAEGWLPESRVPAAAGGFGFGPVSLPAIFEPELLYGVLPDGTVVFSDSSTYRLKLTPPDAGRRVGRVVTRPISPRPVTPAVRRT